MRRLYRYSEAFKMEVVKAMDAGKFKTILAAKRAYGVHGGDTIGTWVAKYGKDPQFRKVVRVETVNERDERQELRKEVKKLKGAVADLHLDNRLESAFLKIACQNLGMSVEEFKKKHDAKL